MQAPRSRACRPVSAPAGSIIHHRRGIDGREARSGYRPSQLVGAADTPLAAALPAVALTDRQLNSSVKEQAAEDDPQPSYETPAS